MVRKNILVWLFLVLGSVSVFGQKTLVYAQEDADFKHAMKLLEKEKYSAAQREFKKVYDRIPTAHSDVKMYSEYYIALCALELFNEDAEKLFVDFIDHHPQSPHVKQAIFQLGRYNYRKKKWTSTVQWLSQLDEIDVEPKDLPEYFFEYGYALFMKDEFVEAQKFFHKGKDIEGDFKVPSLFYFSHLAYKFGYYETALTGFESLKTDESFGSVVPYYITQIYYLQKKYDELVIFGTLFLDSANTKRAPEIARLIAEGYYFKNDYENSVKYFEIFQEKAGEMDTLGSYQLGYAYYQKGNFQKALINFQKSADDETAVGQLSMYYIGDCYLKLANKRAARSAFKFASKNDHDRGITENALFNYAKLSFELDIDPYHESIIALEQFIRKYPDSPNVDKARKYLLNVYLNSKNYQSAMVALDQIKDKNMDLKYAYQKIAYYRGVQIFNAEKVGFKKNNKENYKEAIFYFNKSLTYPEDKKVVALATYWKAESYYRLGDYKKAIKYFEEFKISSGAILLDEFQEVNYQLGYAYLGLKDYGPAIRAFRSFAGQKKDLNPEKVTDALIRTGDSYLLLSKNLEGLDRKGELSHATNFFKQALNASSRESDYVYYQLAQVYFLLNEYGLQAEALENLISKYPDSKYIDDAKFKAGQVYMDNIEKNEIALRYFNEIVTKHSNNIILVQKSYNKIGYIYQSERKPEKALAAFEKSIALDPRSISAKEAMIAHQQTCVHDLGDADRHFKFRTNIGLPEADMAIRDSATFIAAKKFFIERDYPVAAKGLNKYINDFPNGLHIVPASYFLAESYFAMNQFDLALKHYETVINAPYGEYSEHALYVSAKTYLKQKDYQKAISHYLALEESSEYPDYILEARIGLMQAYEKVEDHSNTAKYAALVESSDKVDNINKQKAALILGKSKLKGFLFDEALPAFRRAQAYKQNEEGAEASYNVAYIYYLKEDYEGSTQEIYTIAREFSDYKYWVTKSFILLSDNFRKKNDFFQAKYVLNTVIENYKGADLVDEARAKLQEINELEKASLMKVKQEEVKVNIGGEAPTNTNLFDEPSEAEQDILVPTDSLEMPVDTIR